MLGRYTTGPFFKRAGGSLLYIGNHVKRILALTSGEWSDVESLRRFQRAAK
jgi:hypothetical protein